MFCTSVRGVVVNGARQTEPLVAAPVCHSLEPKGWKTGGVLRGQISDAH